MDIAGLLESIVTDAARIPIPMLSERLGKYGGLGRLRLPRRRGRLVHGRCGSISAAQARQGRRVCLWPIGEVFVNAINVGPQRSCGLDLPDASLTVRDLVLTCGCLARKTAPASGGRSRRRLH